VYICRKRYSLWWISSTSDKIELGKALRFICPTVRGKAEKRILITMKKNEKCSNKKMVEANS